MLSIQKSLDRESVNNIGSHIVWLPILMLLMHECYHLLDLISQAIVIIFISIVLYFEDIIYLCRKVVSYYGE